MSIKWRVENVTVERTCSTDFPVVEANLRGYVDSSRDVSPYSLAGLGRMIEGKLNDDPQAQSRISYRNYSRPGISAPYTPPYTIKNVIFNEPATIVFWADGTKTVVKCQDGDVFDPEKGLAMAFMKKVLGNKGHYFEEVKKWVPEEYKEMGVISNLITDMTLGGATNDELARAVRHSMVVIDAGKHKLDYKQSEIDNDIISLKKAYQNEEPAEATCNIKLDGGVMKKLSEELASRLFPVTLEFKGCTVKERPENPCIGCDHGWGSAIANGEAKSCHDECEIYKDYIKSLKEDK